MKLHVSQINLTAMCRERIQLILTIKEIKENNCIVRESRPLVGAGQHIYIYLVRVLYVAVN